MTAREILCQQATQLLSQPLNEETSRQLWNIIDQFRVQAKPGYHLLPGKTARETLADHIRSIWQSKQADRVQQLMDLIDRFRMQNKQSATAHTSDKTTLTTLQSQQETVKKTKELIATPKQPVPAQSPYEPIGGGPQKRGNARGQCPKCHSMGVVLARSYTGDEYFSCIYCGHQSFRAGIDPDMDLPLAAELLQRKFDENDQDE